MQLTDPALEVKISDEEFAERRKRVEAAARAEGLDALIAFSTTSLQGASAYLTGYEPRFGPKEVTAVAVVPGGAAALVSYAYWDELGPMPWLDEVLVQPDLQKIATTIADRIPEGARRVGVAGYAHFPAPFAAAVARVRPKVLLEDATGMLLGLAVTKTEAEIGLLTAAARMTDAGIRAFLESVGDGVEETHISIAVEKAMIDAGAERFAFPLLIFGGARIASGIGFAAHRRVRAGDQVNIVCGAVHRTYKMDIGPCHDRWSSARGCPLGHGGRCRDDRGDARADAAGRASASALRRRHARREGARPRRLDLAVRGAGIRRSRHRLLAR
jgi:Xaa-Pro aminopeptidase